jgi:hypothetical protein
MNTMENEMTTKNRESHASAISGESMLSRTLLSDAAFQLLASSTIGRYIREARRLTEESGLPDQLQRDAALRARAWARLADLLEEVEREAMRVPAEFEAAILLCALAPIDPEGSRPPLRRGLTSSSPWIRALAAQVSSPGATRAELSCAA